MSATCITHIPESARSALTLSRLRPTIVLATVRARFKPQAAVAPGIARATFAHHCPMQLSPIARLPLCGWCDAWVGLPSLGISLRPFIGRC